MGLLKPEEAHRLAAYLPEEFGFVAWDTQTPIAVPDSVILGAMDKYTLYKVKLPKANDLNSRGLELEKSGSLSDAIDVYEQNIVPDAYLTRLPYDRLSVLYRKLKDYDNEIRVLTLAFERTGDKSYQARLMKARQLKSK